MSLLSQSVRICVVSLLVGQAKNSPIDGNELGQQVKQVNTLAEWILGLGLWQ